MSSLGAKRWVQIRVAIKKRNSSLKTTIIYVAHDQIEAMTMADKIVAIRDGRVEQIGKPLDLYDRPSHIFVVGFIGWPSMNFLQGKVTNRYGRQFVLTGAGISLPLEGVAGQENHAATYGIRPEHISIGEGGIPVDVSVLDPTGSETLIFGRLAGIPIDAVVRDRIDTEPGQTLPFHIDPRRAHVFDQATGQRI